ncbi:putative NAD(P)H nitroreductase [compost metagenome]
MMNEIQQLPVEIANMKQATYDAFLKTNFAIEDDPRVMFEWACRQTYIALGNMLTAAAMIGIDSCPIEGFNRKKVNELLIQEGIMDPEHYGVSCMAAFGYRANEPLAKTRQNAEQIITWID